MDQNLQNEDTISGIKVCKEPIDCFREGVAHNAASKLAPAHPVDAMQKRQLRDEHEARIQDITALYGTGAAMKYGADAKLLSSVHRLPGLESSFCGLENYTGDDLSIKAEDWLGDPQNSEEYLSNVHLTMEMKLGM